MATYTKTVDPNGSADYASIALWEAGEQTLYSSGDIAIADCRRTGATKDTTAVTIAGWTSGVIPKIVVNAAHRHEGKWADQRGDGNYIYTHESGGNSVTVQTNNTTIDGLLFGLTGTTAFRYCVYGATSYIGLIISNNICRNLGSGTDRHGIECNGSIINNIAIGFGGYGFRGLGSSGSVVAYNNTSYGCNIGFTTGFNHTALKNNAALNCTTCFSGSFSTPDYNVSSDATAPTAGGNYAHNKTAYADYFVDHTNGDFHLKGSSLSLWGLAGTDLSGTFTTDIDGQTRVNWDIGADEYIAAGGSSVNSTFEVPFDIRAFVASAFAIPFDIGTIVNSGLATPYDIFNSVSSALQFEYDILNTAASSIGIPYDIRALVDGEFEMVFDVRGSVQADFEAIYDMAGRVFSEFTIQYNLGQVRVKGRRSRLALNLKL